MEELSLKKNILWNTAGSLVYQGCLWLTTIAVVVFSPTFENSGVLAFAMATGNVFFAAATYNMRTFQVSDVAGRFSPGNYVGFRMLTVLASLAVFGVYSAVVAADADAAIALIAYLAFKADEAFSTVLYGIDQRHGRMDFVGISQTVRGVAVIGLFCAGLLATGSLAVAVGGMAFAGIAVTVLYDVRMSKRLDALQPRLNRKVAAEMARACLPVVVAAVLFCLSVAVARQYYGMAYGSESLGIYASVATPCVVVQALFSYLYTPFLVRIAAARDAGECKTLAALLGKMIAMLAAVAVVCLLAAAVAGEPFIVAVFGDKVADAAWMIKPAALAAVVMSTSGLCVDLLTVSRRMGVVLTLNMLALAVCVACCVPFCAWWGMNGVNLVIIVAFATSAIVGIVALAGPRGLRVQQG